MFSLTFLSFRIEFFFCAYNLMLIEFFSAVKFLIILLLCFVLNSFIPVHNVNNICFDHMSRLHGDWIRIFRWHIIYIAVHVMHTHWYRGNDSTHNHWAYLRQTTAIVGYRIVRFVKYVSIVVIDCALLIFLFFFYQKVF